MLGGLSWPISLLHLICTHQNNEETFCSVYYVIFYVGGEQMMKVTAAGLLGKRRMGEMLFASCA